MAMQIEIRSFPERTRARVQALESYMRANVLDDERFICASEAACRHSCIGKSFYEGQLSHVGSHYDLMLNGQPTRIVIVGQEYGDGSRKVGLAERVGVIGWSASQPFNSKGRNPHMRGTASILRLLLGRYPGVDAEGEQLLPGAHIFDGFALVNYLLCSALREQRDAFSDRYEGSGKGASTATMRRNCARHFLKTLEILEPTMIVAQGTGVRSWIGAALGLRDHAARAEKIRIEKIRIGGATVDLVTLYHPSAGGAVGYWGRSTRSDYLLHVAPILRAFAPAPTTSHRVAAGLAATGPNALLS